MAIQKKKTGNGIGKRVVDVTNRIRKSFGFNIPQLIEIHYDGPQRISYVGPLEEVDVAVVDVPSEDGSTKHQVVASKLGEQKPEGREVDVDPTKMIDENGKVVDVPEEKRIKDFDPKKIRYYRTFPTKDPFAVKYFATYDQDLIGDAPQVKFSDTSMGSKSLNRFTIVILGIISSIVEFITIIVVTASYNPYYNPTVNTSTLNYYIPLAMGIIFLILLYIIHTRDMMRTYVRFLILQPIPMMVGKDTNIIPVFLTNSKPKPVWDYMVRVLHLTGEDAKKVFHAIQTWNEKAMEELILDKEVLNMNYALNEIDQEMQKLKGLDRELAQGPIQKMKVWQQWVQSSEA